MNKFDEEISEDLLMKYNKKLKEFGLERVIIDYIQWLGDQIFEEVLNNHKRRLKK